LVKLTLKYPITFRVFPASFICDNCHLKKGTKRKENRFAAKRLPTTRLGNYVENRVNNFLRKKEADSGEVYIRVVYSGDKTVEVKQGMKKR
jgi:E1A/CREB-binding protein